MPRPSAPILLKTIAFLSLSLVPALLGSARAQETIASYPPLPTGQVSIKVFDSKGSFVGRLLPEKRYWVSIDRIPVFLQQAVVAVEDARFYEHGGIDVRGIARALMKDAMKGRLVEGGSTITQQLIKNKYLSAQKTIDRKLEEARMAMDFEKKYTKRQILEMYLNEIYYGNGAWGIAQAARLYFDKSPEELTDAECSLLAGVPKSPATYNPLGKPDNVTKRRDVVLKRMTDLGLITRRQQQDLRAHPPSVLRANQAPYYLAHVRSKLLERYGPAVVEEGGLEVTAALDLRLQRQAELVMQEGVRKLSPELQGALLCLDPATGQVLAAVGGVDAKAGAGSYDRAFSARRQPGSSVKPFIYALALEQGFTPLSVFDDAPVAYSLGNGESWKPKNYDGKTYGELTLRQALAVSNNVVTVKLLADLGIPRFVEFAAKVGLPLHGQNGLSLALGTDEVSLSELVLAYATLADGGTRPEPRMILRVHDRRRGTLAEDPQIAVPVLSPATAYVTTQMLRDVLLTGTAKTLKKFALQVPSAGKTGTTDDYRDAWFVGYTPQLVTGVWLGYDRPRPGGKGFTGGVVAAPLWERFMRTAVAGRPATDFAKPEGVVSAFIDPSTGSLATPDCPEKREEFFLTGTEPTVYCARHGGAPTPPPSPEPAAVSDPPSEPGPTAPGQEEQP